MNTIKNLFNKHKLVLVIAVLFLLIIIIAVANRNKEIETPSTYNISSQSAPDGGTGEEPAAYSPDWGIKFNKEYPWYKKIPIETKEFVIIFDFEVDKFRIILNIPENSTQNLKNSLTSKAVEEIKKLTGESFDQYEYYVVFGN